MIKALLVGIYGKVSPGKRRQPVLVDVVAVLVRIVCPGPRARFKGLSSGLQGVSWMPAPSSRQRHPNLRHRLSADLLIDLHMSTQRPAPMPSLNMADEARLRTSLTRSSSSFMHVS